MGPTDHSKAKHPCVPGWGSRPPWSTQEPEFWWSETPGGRRIPEKGPGLKAAPQAARRLEGRRGSRSPREGLTPCSRDALWRAWLCEIWASGFGCERIRSDPIRAWAVGFAPLPGSANARPPSWRPGDLPESLPARNTGLVQNPRGSMRPEPGLFPQWGLVLPPPAALLDPAPTLRVTGPATSPPPCLPRGGWVPPGRGPVPPVHLGRDRGPIPQVSRPCTCRLTPRAAPCACPALPVRLPRAPGPCVS